jgi:hypothetical protein
VSFDLFLLELRVLLGSLTICCSTDTQPREGAAAFAGRGAETDVVSRTHNMTLDEACDILNVKTSKMAENEELTRMLKVCCFYSYFCFQPATLFGIVMLNFLAVLKELRSFIRCQ